MKKPFALIGILACLLLCACTANRSEPALTSEADENDASPTASSIEFTSFQEWQEALAPQNEAKLYSYFSEQNVGNDRMEAVKNMVKAIQRYDNIVPYVDGVVPELRNEEGFSNITLFSSEKYGLPCIFYHPKVSTDDNLYIKITCIPEDMVQEEETVTASDLIKRLAPSYPNVDNPGDLCSAVYNMVVNLRDREVTALVYEYKTDNRNSTMFVYDNLLVEVRNDPSVWDSEWFSSLSFGGFETRKK